MANQTTLTGFPWVLFSNVFDREQGRGGESRYYEHHQKLFGLYRTVLWTLWERERVGRFGRMALKHVKYHV